MSFKDVFCKDAVFPAEAAVLDTEPAYGPNGNDFSGNYHPTTAAETRLGVQFGSNSGQTGTYAGSGSSGNCDENAIAEAVISRIGSGVVTAILLDGDVVGFPEELTVGDAYLQSNGRQIWLRLLSQGHDTPITTFGGKAIRDATATLRMNRGTLPSEVTATVSYVDETADPRFMIELPASETAKAKPDQDYTWQLILNWDGNTESETTPVKSGCVRFAKKISA